MFSSSDDEEDGILFKFFDEEHFPKFAQFGARPCHFVVEFLPRKEEPILQKKCPYLELIHPDFLRDSTSTDGEISSDSENDLPGEMSQLQIIKETNISREVKKSNQKLKNKEKTSEIKHSSRKHREVKQKRHLSLSDSDDDDGVQHTGIKSVKIKKKHLSSGNKRQHDSSEDENSEVSEPQKEFTDLREKLNKSKNIPPKNKNESVPCPSKYKNFDDVPGPSQPRESDVYRPSRHIKTETDPAPSKYRTPKVYPSTSSYKEPTAYPSTSSYKEPTAYPSTSSYKEPIGYPSTSSYRKLENDPGAYTKPDDRIKTDPHMSYDSEQDYSGEEESYECEPCKSTMNSKKSWRAHLSGKRHIRTLKMLNPAKAALDSLHSTVTNIPTSRCPVVSPGFQRVSINQESEIQRVIDSMKPICPGLDSVMEIIKEDGLLRTYYCELCQAICIAETIVKHLKSHNHRLRCVQQSDLFLHSQWNDVRKKRYTSPQIVSYFKKQEKRYGRGKIRVYKDVPLTTNRSLAGPSGLSQQSQVPKTESSVDTSQDSEDCNNPALFKGNNFYCSICDCYMNNLGMWQSHLHGKRHLKNIKKKPDEQPSKIKFVKSDRPCELLDKITDHMIIVGLDFVQEKKNEMGCVYDCLLCNCHLNTVDVFEHLQSMKHRRKYLEKVDTKKADCLKDLTKRMSQYNIDVLYQEAALQELAEKGMGTPEVLEPK